MATARSASPLPHGRARLPTLLTRALPAPRAQGEHLLHVLNTLESRAVVLEAELREIDEDIALNSTMARKYGEQFFTEGSARLTQTRVEKQLKLSEIRRQLQDTSSSVRQGKQLLGSLAENYGNSAPVAMMMQAAEAAQAPGSPGSCSSPMKILTTSPILSEKRSA